MLAKKNINGALLILILGLSSLQAEESVYKQFMHDRQKVEQGKELLKKVQDGQMQHRDVIGQADKTVKNLNKTFKIINDILGDNEYKNCMVVEATITNQKYLLDYIKERAKNGEITKSDKEYLLKVNAVSTKLQKTQQECKKTYGDKL